MTNDETSSPEKVAPTEVPEALRRKLGTLVDYAMAALIGTASKDETIQRFRQVRDEISEIIFSVTRDPQDSLMRGNHLRHGEYPDTPFYNGILPGDEANFDTLEEGEELPEGAVMLIVIADHYLYAPGANEVIKLFGDPLYVCNALFKNRGVARAPAFYMKFGFMQSATRDTTRKRFKYAAENLKSTLNKVTPAGFDPFIEGGRGLGSGRMLNPAFVILDKRGDPAFAHLIPKEDDSWQEGEPVEGMTITEVAAASGAAKETVRRRFRELLGDNPRNRSELAILPMPQAEQLVDELIAEHSHPIVDMPPGFCRLRPLLTQLQAEIGVKISMSQVVHSLTAAGYHPQKLNIDKIHATKGGVWCVEESGALDILRADTSFGSLRGVKAEPAATPAPAAQKEGVEPPDEQAPEPGLEPPAEPEAPALVELKMRNSATDIIANLAARGHTVTEGQVLNAAQNNPLIIPEYDRTLKTDVYSHRSARRIIAALTGEPDGSL